MQSGEERGGTLDPEGEQDHLGCALR